MFDVSHMGEIWVKGPRALDLLRYIGSNDAASLYDGKIQYSCLPNGRGGIVDDILVYRIDAETYLLVVNAANVEKDWNHLVAAGERFGLRPGRELYNASDEIAQLAVQGPLAMRIVQRLCPAADLGKLAYYTFVKTEVAGIADAIVSATGYTGAGGCEIYVANEDAPRLWEALWQAGERDGLQNIGLGARDTLRLEMGYCLYGNDIDDTTSPVEAGLGWITKTGGDRDFIDRPLLERQKREGVSRRLVGFELTERGVPRPWLPGLPTPRDARSAPSRRARCRPRSKKASAWVTSKRPMPSPGTPIAVVIREKPVAARIVKLPFIPNR